MHITAPHQRASTESHNQTLGRLIGLRGRAHEAFLGLLKVTAPELFVLMTGGFRGPVLPKQIAASRRLDIYNAGSTP